MTDISRTIALETPLADTTGLSQTSFSLPGYMNLPPVTFFNTVKGQQNVLPQIGGMTVWGAETLTLETWVQNEWGKHALYAITPNSGDMLTYNALTSMWQPTPVTNPVVYSQKIYNDATDVLEVKRFYKSNALTNTSGTTTGSLTPTGAHTLTGSVDSSYKLAIDSAGSQSGFDATFKWSSDGGTTYTAFAVPIATGAADGRKVLTPILLDNGVTVTFGQGVFTSGDFWTFTAIATGNQLFDLKVDTTNSIVKVGTQLQIANDADFSIYETFGNPTILWGGTQAGNIQYDRTNNAFNHNVNGSTIGRVDNLGLTLPLRPLVLGVIATPASPAAGGKYYSKTVTLARPHWLDTAGLEQNMLPLTTKGDLYAFSATSDRLAVGTNDFILTADSTAATGLKWAANAASTLLTTKGDLFTFSTVNARLGVGANNTILQADSTQATGLGWTATPTLTSATITTGTIATLQGSTASGGGLTIKSTSHATKGLITIGTSGYDEVNNRLGIGTTTPGGSNAAALLEINGVSSNATTGPNMKFTCSATDAYPLLQMLPFSHDNVNIGFDTYYDGAFRSASSSAVNYWFRKLSGLLDVNYTDAVAQGNVNTLNVAFRFSGTNQLSAGYLRVGSLTGPSNTTAGDLTALRAVLGTDAAMPASTSIYLNAATKVNGSIGFFNTAPQTQQAGVENVTNNVTAGGTTGTIADFTSLTVYATDAAAIRNDIYQLSRGLKQVKDALRLYGLLS